MRNKSPDNQDESPISAPNVESSSLGADSLEIARFECKQCGNCCRGIGYVRITPDDAERIARFLNIKLASFYNQYTFRPEGLISNSTENTEWWLLDTESHECVFLEKNLCKIHPVKPLQCRDFPQQWHPRDFFLYCKGMRD